MLGAPQPDSRQEAPPRGLAGGHVVRVWGPHVQGSSRSFLPLWGEGLTITAKTTWRPGEGPEQRQAVGRHGGPQRPLPLLAVSLELRLSEFSLSLSLPVCVSLSL